jgi:2-dehydro-3-deoxygluconokinase
MKKVVTLGEVMLRLAPLNNARFTQAQSFNATYGGGEANVAASLAQFGIPAAHVTAFPENEIGDAAINYYKQLSVETTYMLQRGKRIGTYFVEFGSALRASKIIYDREYSAMAMAQPEWFDWDEIFKDAGWFHWTGITPALSENCLQITKQAIQKASEKGITISADVNYRSNLWQYGKTAQEIMPDLVNGCDIITCSERDASDIFGIEVETGVENTFINSSDQMMAAFPKIKKILTTRRTTHSASHNALKGIMYDGLAYTESQTIDIEPIIDRIGGGDAFIAGYIYGELMLETAKEALDFAVAASALKHTINGDVNLVSVEEVNDVVAGDTSGRIKR